MTAAILALVACVAGAGDARAESGAFLLGDLDPGAEMRGAAPGAIVSLGSIAVFTADDQVRGRELWRTDGTDAGTELVRDIRPGPEPSVADPRMDFVAAGAAAYFVASDGVRDHALWRSDGTAPGTWPLMDVPPVSEGVSYRELTAAGERVYARKLIWGGWELRAAEPGRRGLGLARSFPSSAGMFASRWTHLGSILYFVADDGISGDDLWRSDGTSAGTWRVADLAGPPQELCAKDGRLYFRVQSHGRWESDGTGVGTVPSAVTAVPSPTGENECVSTTLSPFAVETGGKTFWFDDSSNLWVRDSPEAAARLVANVPQPYDFPNQRPVGVEGTLFWAGQDPTHGVELWRSDGTPSGTFVTDVSPGTHSSLPSALVELNGSLLLSAGGPHGRDLWRVVPASPDALLVQDIARPPAGSAPGTPIEFGGLQYFAATDLEHGRELWVSDGTREGTRLLADVAPGPAGSWPRAFAELGGLLYFTTAGSDAWPPRVELWRTDGTAAGTVRAARIESSRYADYADHLTRVGGQLLFVVAATMYEHPVPQDFVAELWSSDGSQEGTARLASTSAWPASDPILEVAEGVAVFAGMKLDPSDSEVFDVEPWRTDGTALGTQRIADLVAGTEGSFPSSFTLLERDADTVLLFGSSTGLWKTSVDLGPLELVASFAGGAGALAALDGVALFFTAGNELWRTDGTAAGTRFVKALPRAPLLDPVRLGERIYFPASDARFGAELWRSDGTAEGTTLVREVSPGENGGVLTLSAPLFRLGDRLLFTGCDARGCEPWVSDGTALGTRQAAEILRGSRGSRDPFFPHGDFFAPQSGFARAGNLVLFGADDGENGRELWAIPVASLEECLLVGDLDGDGDVDADDSARLRAAYGSSAGDARFDPAADLDHDGSIALVDWQLEIDALRVYEQETSAAAAQTSAAAAGAAAEAEPVPALSSAAALALAGMLIAAGVTASRAAR